MAAKPLTSFQTWALQQLQRAQATTAKRMFGGVGLYHAGRIFALMDDNGLWLKADATTQAEFEARGMGPFAPFGDGGPVMQYWQVPEDVLEDVAELRRWCEAAITVATAPRPAKRTRRR